MYHIIEFKQHIMLDVERSRRERLERVRVRAGSRVCAEIRPYTAESPGGPIEVADLHLDDGTTTRAVPFAWFAFVDSDDSER